MSTATDYTALLRTQSAPKQVAITLTIEVPGDVSEAELLELTSNFRKQAAYRLGSVPTARVQTLNGGDNRAKLVRPRPLPTHALGKNPLRPAPIGASKKLKLSGETTYAGTEESSLNKLTVDLLGRNVQINGEYVNLANKEFEILQVLTTNANQIVSREHILQAVWGNARSDVSERTVDVHIRRLRNKLGNYRRLIGTIRGQGYRFSLGRDVHVLK